MTQARRELSDLWAIAQFCGGAKRTPKGVKFCCPIHRDRNPSCAAWLSDDGLRIKVKCFAGCERDDLADALTQRGFVLSLRRTKARVAAAVIRIKQVDEARAKDEAWWQDRARDLWANSVDIRDTPAQRYLERRGLSLAHVDHLHGVLRFHASCPRGKGCRQPAMLAAYRNIMSDKLVAVHRIFIGRDGMKDGAMMMGPCVNAAIKLASQGACFGKSNWCEVLHVSEGIETGLAAMGFGYRPLWALGSTGMFVNFAPLFGVGRLVVCADNDKAGRIAATDLVRKWLAQDIPASMVLPGSEGDDYADVARRLMMEVA